MKTKRLGYLLLTALLLSACGKDKPNTPPTPSGGGSGSGGTTPPSVEDYFNDYDNANAHNRLKQIAEVNGGFTIDFKLYSKVNDTVTIENHLALGRKDKVAWAENTLYTLNPNPDEIALPYTVKGAVEFTDDQESLFDVYYAEGSDEYEYYGTAYDEDIDLSVQELESYFDLSDSLFVALLTEQQATLKTLANRRCFYFEMNNMTLGGDYLSNAHLEIGFDSETRLILYYNYFEIRMDEQNRPTVYMTVLEVDALNFAVNAPTLVK